MVAGGSVCDYKPRDQYEGKYSIVASKVGQHTLVVALESNGDEPVENVRPRVEALARLVVAKLQ